jgi:hypothetical protein
MVSLEEATRIVVDYLRPFPSCRPTLGSLEDHEVTDVETGDAYWMVKVDVGLLKPQFIMFWVKKSTGEILRASIL